MALNWNRWIKREWHRIASAAEPAVTLLSPPSALREPPFGDILTVFEHYHRQALNGGRSVEITLNDTDSIAYNMARAVWLATELAEASPVLSGWRLHSARRRAFERYSFTLVPLGRSVGLAVRASRAMHGDAAWNIMRAKWLEAQVGHLVLSGGPLPAAVTTRTVAEAAVAGEPGPAVILDWTNLTYGIEIECIRPTEISMIEFARRISDAGVLCSAEMYNHAARGYWKIVTDGSLSDRRGIGMEVVSPILRGTADFEQIRKVTEVLIGTGARPICRINRTCGLHVHVGLPRREHTLPIKVLRAYHAYESVLDSLMPPSRRGFSNNYAQPVRFNDRIATATTLDTLRRAYGYAERYKKVNIESIWRHGTIEYRQHAGTIEAEKIIAWATMVLKLTAVANSGPELPPSQTEATLEGLLALVGADEEAKAFWTRRQALLAGPETTAVAA